MFMKKDAPPMHLTMMKDIFADNKISKDVYENIMHRNVERILS